MWAYCVHCLSQEIGGYEHDGNDDGDATGYRAET